MSENEKLIDALLNERVSRAVDRIFNQNRPDKLSEVYSTVQNKIRANTSELRQTLYRKYQSLINCSQLLDGLNSFAEDINGISQEMSKIISQKQYEDEVDCQSKTPIDKIEALVDKQQFHKAMIGCINNLPQDGDRGLIQSGESVQQSFYLQYLKVEIIEKLQKFIDRNKFDRQMVSQVMQTIKIFLQSVTFDELEAICQGRNRQLLAIVCSASRSYLQQRQILKSQKLDLSDTQLVRSLFEYKLTTLGFCKQEQEIYKFFHDLLQLSRNNDDQRLKVLFEENWMQMSESLAHIFIQRQQNSSELHFQYDLYERLVSSQQFLGIFKKIETNLSLSNDKQIIKSFETLWQDYYHQMLEHINRKINPVNYIHKLSEGKSKADQLPKQFHEYLIDRSLDITFEIRKLYKNILISCKNSMNLLCQKGDSEKITRRFSQSISQINTSLEQELENHKKQPQEEVKLRECVLLSILAADFNKKHPQQKFAWMVGNQMNTPYLTQAHVRLFLSQVDFEKNMLKMDIFFTGYSVPRLELQDLNVIQTIILSLLNSLIDMNAQNEERYRYIIGQLNNESQPLSIYKSSLSNIRQYIFLRSFKEECSFDEPLFGKYLQEQQSSNITMEMQRNDDNDDGFEIGQKQTAEDMVQIGMKGMKTMGNFISGFMRKT